MSDVTQILAKIESGDQRASEELLPLVYEELRRIAACRMSTERPDNTLQATALVHEAYLRLVGKDEPQHWNSRGHFFSAAAEAMRRILIDRARHKEAIRGGGSVRRVPLDGVEPASKSSGVDLLALNEALLQLERDDPRKAELVKLRFFAGLSVREAAKALGIAPSTAISDWAYAKGWLRLQMAGEDS